MEYQNCELMKYSYPASLITLSAAIAQACSLHINKYDNAVAYLASKDSTFVQLNINNHQPDQRVGIKFDNISAGKYFVLLRSIQRKAMAKRTTEKYEHLIPAESHVTTEKNELLMFNGRNGPSVYGQSTFL